MNRDGFIQKRMRFYKKAGRRIFSCKIRRPAAVGPLPGIRSQGLYSKPGNVGWARDLKHVLTQGSGMAAKAHPNGVQRLCIQVFIADES